MLCPFCSDDNTRVVDSRFDTTGNQIKRRRECGQCQGRFTTYERVELSMPRIIKRDGRTCVFDEHKLRDGLMKAFEKRPVSHDIIENMVAKMVSSIHRKGDREVCTQFIGELVMRELREIDSVAYIRYASVHLGFQDVNAFREVISTLEKRKDSLQDH